MKKQKLVIMGALLTVLFACKKASQIEKEKILTVTTIAGSGGDSYAEGIGQEAVFNEPSSLVVDASGNIFVTDRVNSCIRKITPNGASSIIAGLPGQRGYQDGPGNQALFNFPDGIALDANGNIYISDSGNNVIRKITSNGIVSILAGSNSYGFVDGPALTAKFAYPKELVLDASGNIYVADKGNYRIRKITPAGIVSTLAGDGIRGTTDGPGNAARFDDPDGLAIDAAGNIYVSGNRGSSLIRKVTKEGVVSTLAGNRQDKPGAYVDGPGVTASFKNPSGLCIDPLGNVYVADVENYRIRKITPGGFTTTFAGNGTNVSGDGPVLNAGIKYPTDIAIDNAGNFYFTEGFGSSRIRKISMIDKEDKPKSPEEIAKDNWSKPIGWK